MVCVLTPAKPQCMSPPHLLPLARPPTAFCPLFPAGSRRHPVGDESRARRPAAPAFSLMQPSTQMQECRHEPAQTFKLYRIATGKSWASGIFWWNSELKRLEHHKGARGKYEKAKAKNKKDKVFVVNVPSTWNGSRHQRRSRCTRP